jgi:hypothetical protein
VGREKHLIESISKKIIKKNTTVYDFCEIIFVIPTVSVILWRTAWGVQGVRRLQAIEGSGMAGLSDTLGSPWPPLAICL